MGERGRGLLAAALLLAGCSDDAGTATEGAGADTGAAASPTSGEGPTTGAASTGPGGATEAASAADSGSSGGPGTTGMSPEPVEGHFLAVGDGGVRARSADGAAWESQVGSGLLDLDSDMAPPDALRAVALGDGYVIAVGGGGNFFTGNSMVMRSDDGGATWQEDLLAGAPDYQPHKLYGVAHADGVLVAVGMRGKRIRSEDGGLSWTDISDADTNARLHAVAAAGSTFVVAGWTEDSYESPKTSILLTSSDRGLTWGPADESFERLDDLAVGGGTFVAVGATECIRATDGVTWSDCGLVSEEYQGIDYVAGAFVATTLEGLSTSPDGVTWSEPIAPPLGAPTDLAFGNGRYAGVRWTERGWAEELGDWAYATYATEPLRAIVFVPAE